MRLAHAIEINAFTLDGSEGPTLSATWSWAPALITDAQVRALAQGWFQALEALEAVQLPTSAEEIRQGLAGMLPLVT